MEKSDKLGNSTDEQELLRAVALWAADYAEEALSVFESRHPEDIRPRAAIQAGRAFGRGKKRDKDLRIIALAAFKAMKGLDEPSKHAARAASLAAAVAYTHTDLQSGAQGVRQAQHILGPVVHAALSLEIAAGDAKIGDAIIRKAARNAPPEVAGILAHMPPQLKTNNRLNILFSNLDSALRSDVLL